MKQVTYTFLGVLHIPSGKIVFVSRTFRPAARITREIMRGREVRPLLGKRIKAARSDYDVKLLETGVSHGDKRQRRLAWIKQLRTFEPHGYNSLGAHNG